MPITLFHDCGPFLRFLKNAQKKLILGLKIAGMVLSFFGRKIVGEIDVGKSPKNSPKSQGG